MPAFWNRIYGSLLYSTRVPELVHQSHELRPPVASAALTIMIAKLRNRIRGIS